MDYSGLANDYTLNKSTRKRLLEQSINQAYRTERNALKADIAQMKREFWEERRDTKALRKNAVGLGLDPEEMTLRYKYSDKMCEICGIHEDDVPELHLCMDHDHTTGEFRGWLCKPCNSGIGYLKDSADLVASALKYLER